MALPSPDKIKWSEWKENYKVTTPTFKLTAVEKPDMSPFLIHMTGKDAILSILRGENAPDSIPCKTGYLKASVPEYNQSIIKAPVVCFTESPTFALDFFRYRSFDRWKADQRYGIGFDKTMMAEAGVRPVVYVDQAMRRNLILLAQHMERAENKLVNDLRINTLLVDTLVRLFPLSFPLLEDRAEQGFIWEREWRHPDPAGFIFDHQSIKIVCCPRDEENEIRQVLGDVAEKIQFIRVWREYDDITTYLMRQKPVWEAQTSNYRQASSLKEAAGRLRILIGQQKTAYNSLESYTEYVKYLEREMIRSISEKQSLAMEIERLEKELKDVEEELRKENELEFSDNIFVDPEVLDPYNAYIPF